MYVCVYVCVCEYAYTCEYRCEYIYVYTCVCLAIREGAVFHSRGSIITEIVFQILLLATKVHPRKRHKAMFLKTSFSLLLIMGVVL